MVFCVMLVLCSYIDRVLNISMVGRLVVKLSSRRVRLVGDL